MKWIFGVLAGGLMLSGCTPATVTDETRTIAVVERGFYAGERYEVRTRVLEGQNGQFTQTQVIYRGFARTCIQDSPNDCESKAESLIEEYDELIF